MRRPYVLKIRLSERERGHIHELAQKNGLSDSEYARRMATGRPLKAVHLGKKATPAPAREPEEPQQPGESREDYIFRMRWSRMTPQERQEFDEVADKATEQQQAAAKATPESDQAQVTRFSRETDDLLRQQQTADANKLVELGNGIIL